MTQITAADLTKKISRLIQTERITSMTGLVNRLSSISDYLGFVARYPVLFQTLVQEQKKNQEEENLS